MQPGFDFYLNGQQFPAPRDFDRFETELARDLNEHIISEKFRLTVTFYGGAYDYLRGLYDADGYCAEVEVEARQRCGDESHIVLQGIIMLSDCEWNLTRCTVEASVVDRSVGTVLKDNRKVPVSPLADKSKNNASITAVTPLALTMFKAADGTDLVGTRRAFDWYDCIEHALAYISDGTLGVVSDWYAALPDTERLAIANGAELRVSGFHQKRLEYSFDDLFDEVAKRYNLWIHPETSGGSPVLRIEPESYFLPLTTEAFSMFAIPDLKRSIDMDRLYATVRVGNDGAVKEVSTGHPLPYIPMLGFVAEAFHFSGVCNTDEELDLVGDWNADTNAIKDIVEGGVTDYDDDWFLIQYTATTSKPTQGQYFNIGAAPYLYNEALLNSAILARYPLPSAVGANYGTGFDDSFLAQRTYATNAGETSGAQASDVDAIGTNYGPYSMRFDNDYTAPGFDTNNTWGNGTAQGNPVSLADSRFTATGTGYYTFTAFMPWQISRFRPAWELHTFFGALLPTPKWRAVGIIRTFSARAYNSGGTPLTGVVTLASAETRYIAGNYNDTFTVSFSLSPGDYVVFYSGWRRGGDEYFSAVPGSGFPYNPNDPDDLGFVGVRFNFQNTLCTVGTSMIQDGGTLTPTQAAPVVLYKFSRACPATRWVDATTYPSRYVTIDGGVRGHVKNLKRNLLEGTADWEIITTP